MASSFELIGVGNPIMDILAHVDDAFLRQHVAGDKGGMVLVDHSDINTLLGRLGSTVAMAPGGSAANATLGATLLGLKTTYLGKIGADKTAEDYRANFKAAGGDDTRFKHATLPNGRCLSMVTPDGQRTMRTHLGAAMTLNSGFETFNLDEQTFIRPLDTDAWRLRITENFTANLGDSLSLGPVFIYQLTDYGDDDGKVQWMSAGLRPIWHFNPRVSLAAEGGADWVKDDIAGTDGVLYKLTLAPQVSLGGRFMSRPVIRAFVTWASWSDDFVGLIGGQDYLDATDALTAGMHMEVWW